MAICVQGHTSVSKQATLLDGLDVSPLKWRVCVCGLNRIVHVGMNHISNVKVHLKTRSGNVNIRKYSSKKIYLSNIEYDVTTSKCRFYHYCLGSACLDMF